MNKYRNVRRGQYDSKKEERRAFELELLQKCGEISQLEHHPRFELIPKQDGERPVHYEADFSYLDRNGNRVIEDTKGVKTPDYVIKRKLMLWRHNIRVVEL